MNKIQNRRLLHLLTRHVLVKRGYEIPDGYNIEWDPMEPDSQYSMCYEDVQYMIEALEKYNYEIVERTPYGTSQSTARTSATWV